MYEIAEQVRAWLADGRDVTVGQVVATQGFSSRDPSLAAAWVDGDVVGVLLEGLGIEAVADQPAGLVHVRISDAEATAAGLSCGGLASVLVQPASAYPAQLWDHLIAREPVCLVTRVTDDVAGPTTAFTPETIRDAHEHSDQIPRLFGRGTSATAIVDDQAVVSLWPVPTMVVVGDGLIAEALAATAALLGWRSRITNDVDEAVVDATALHHSDAFVVLSHDRAVDGPALAAALAGRVGYVGALGSRRTQEARRKWLTAQGVEHDVQSRMHGPAGLDIDAHTPAEIAISIAAEILASRADSSGGALRDRPGPVHVSGVQAPPPRYS